MKKSSNFRQVTVYVLVALVIVESTMLLLGTSIKDVSAPTIKSADDTTAWKTVNIAGIVTVEIPVNCRLSNDTYYYVICPTAKNDQPTPEMYFSYDDTTLSVRRWENLESPYWDHMVGSLNIVQPLTHDITINIQK